MNEQNIIVPDGQGRATLDLNFEAQDVFSARLQGMLAEHYKGHAIIVSDDGTVSSAWHRALRNSNLPILIAADWPEVSLHAQTPFVIDKRDMIKDITKQMQETADKMDEMMTGHKKFVCKGKHNYTQQPDGSWMCQCTKKL